MRILIFIFFGALFLTSCGSDDCTQESIVGVYQGTLECDESPDPSITLNNGPVTLTVEHISSDTYSATDQDGTGYVLTVDGCNFDIPEVEVDFFGLSIKTSGQGNFDENQINMDVVTEVTGITVNCNLVASK